MSETTHPIVAILATSIYPEKLTGLLDNIENTVNSYDSVEFFIKVDAEDQRMIDFVHQQKKIRKFNIYYVVSPRLDGYWSCWIFLNNLLRLVSEKTYFIWVPNDEIRIQTHGWDNVLKKYYKYFDDDIFHVRLGNYRYHDNSFIDCAPIGEHLSFITKKWWDITEGIRIDATDTGPAFVNYHTKKYFHSNRIVPTGDIEFSNYNTAVSAFHGLDDEKVLTKTNTINKVYCDWLSYDFQSYRHYLAAKVYSHIYAYNNLGKNYSIKIDYKNKSIYAESDNGSLCVSYTYDLDNWLNDIEQSIEFDREYLTWAPVVACLIKEKHKQLSQNSGISPRTLKRLVNLSFETMSASKLTDEYLRLI